MLTITVERFNGQDGSRNDPGSLPGSTMEPGRVLGRHLREILSRTADAAGAESGPSRQSRCLVSLRLFGLVEITHARTSWRAE